MKNTKTNLSISDIFPELKDEDIKKLMSRSKGTVISYNALIKNMEIYQEDDKCVDTLLWVRLIKENLGEDEITILLFSLIKHECIHEYGRIFNL